MAYDNSRLSFPGRVYPGEYPRTQAGVLSGGYPGAYPSVQSSVLNGGYPGAFPSVQSSVLNGGRNFGSGVGYVGDEILDAMRENAVSIIPEEGSISSGQEVNPVLVLGMPEEPKLFGFNRSAVLLAGAAAAAGYYFFCKK